MSPYDEQQRVASTGQEHGYWWKRHNLPGADSNLRQAWFGVRCNSCSSGHVGTKDDCDQWGANHHCNGHACRMLSYRPIPLDDGP